MAGPLSRARIELGVLRYTEMVEMQLAAHRSMKLAEMLGQALADLEDGGGDMAEFKILETMAASAADDAEARLRRVSNLVDQENGNGNGT